MSVHLGAGWRLTHLSDRVVEIRKDDYAYRRLLGHDGYVRVRAEPGMDRATLVARAMERALKDDEILALRVAKRLPFGKAKLAEYRGRQLRMVRAFATDQEPELIGMKRP